MTKLSLLLGHGAAIAHDGPEAFEPARGRRPEPVLLDSGLPERDGDEIASPLQRTAESRLIGGIPTHRRIPCNIPGVSSVLYPWRTYPSIGVRPRTGMHP
jgi:CheY-like chemotaxis protein